MKRNAKTTTAPSVGQPKTENGTASYAGLVAANGRAMNDWLKVSEIVANGMFALSHEMLQFSQTRFREDVEGRVALGRCQNPSEALHCQREFAERTAAQFLAEATKLSGLMTEMANEGFRSMQHSFGAVARSMTRESSYLSPTAD
jgi:hypothetical protein